MEATGLNAGEAANGERIPSVGMEPLVERLRGIRDGLTTGLVERDRAVRLGLLAALAGEHLLLLGPPGTAKSLVARRLRLATREGKYFERLLTRFSAPEELFGPLSISGLQEDRYERLTESYLPTASIAFLDEMFKGQQRDPEFAADPAQRAGVSQRHESGFHAARSSRWGEQRTPGRRGTRCAFRPLPGSHSCRAGLGQGTPDLVALRDEGEPELAGDLKLTPDDLARIRAAAGRVTIPEGVVALLGDLREWCIAEGIRMSDRAGRWRPTFPRSRPTAA